MTNIAFQDLLARHFVGSTDLVKWVTEKTSNATYPPHNVEQLDDEHYLISVAVAGFDRSELEVVVRSGAIEVRGRKAQTDDQKLIYRGIALRDFEKCFKLNDYMVVDGALYKDGMLSIQISVQVPENQKTRTIAID